MKAFDLPLEAACKIVGDDCWCCGKLLADKGGSPEVIRNSHHLVPRAYGGVDGPEIQLCSAHHDLLHQYATKLIAGDTEFMRVARLTGSTAISRCLRLALIVVKAYNAFGGSPNKKTEVRVTGWDPSELDDLNKLTKYFDLTRSQVIRHLVSAAAKKI